MDTQLALSAGVRCHMMIPDEEAGRRDRRVLREGDGKGTGTDTDFLQKLQYPARRVVLQACDGVAI